MTSPTKAVLFDLKAYQADNNIRRSVATFSVNYGSAAESLSLSSFHLAPLAAKTITSPMSPSVVTMIRTNLPVAVVVTFRNASTLTLTVKKLMVLDSDVQSLQITNASPNVDTAKITILQG